MYTKTMLSLDQSQAAINAMIAEFCKDPSNPPVAMAVVDDVGMLLAYARTDGSRPIISRNAIKKAYTAALRGVSSEEFAEELKGRGWSVAEMGDPMLIAVPGGIAVINPADSAVLGGIGVAGFPKGPGDDDLALLGLKAMALSD